LRSTAKWLVTVLTGVAVALLAGVQLTGLGRLGAADWPRLAVATAGLVAALAAIGVLIRDTARVLTDSFVTAADLQDAVIEAQFAADPARGAQLRRLEEQVANLREELYGQVAPDLGTLQRRLREANEQACAAIADAGRPLEEVERAFSRVRLLRDAAREVADYANYHRVRELFTGTRRRRSVAAGVAALGIAAFAWASNPGTPDELVVKFGQPAPAGRQEGTPSGPGRPADGVDRPEVCYVVAQVGARAPVAARELPQLLHREAPVGRLPPAAQDGQPVVPANPNRVERRLTA
jgi:hypothetical protein